MNITEELKPFAFISVRGQETTLIIPQETHTVQGWEDTKKLIVETYIQECIRGEYSNGGNCRGAVEVLEMLERHPEFNCVSFQIERVRNWMLVE
ncbi:MAG: hypothetical protein WC087_00220 [Candidatus Paceibacterota bacterium]